MSYSFIATAKRNDDGTFDAEVALTDYGEGLKVVSSTRQRVVSRGHATKAIAEAEAALWVRNNLYPIMQRLPEAKP